MSKLKHIQRFRFSDDDMDLFAELKKNRVNLSSFVRKAILEKADRDLPRIKQDEILKSKNKYCPF